MAAAPAEELWTLPNGWRWERLGALGSWTGGGTPSKSNAAYWTAGTIPWVSPKDMKCPVITATEDQITEEAVRGSSAKRVASGSVLCVMRSGILSHTFPVAINRVDVTLNQDMRALTPTEGIDPEFVANYLRRSSWDVLGRCSKAGTTVSSIEAPRLDAYPVPVPPLDTQRRIVARVNELFAELDGGEAALQRARGDLETYRRALLKAAVTGELTTDWRAANPPEETGEQLLQRIIAERKARWEAEPNNRQRRYKEPERLNDGQLPPLPRGWCWAALDQLVSERERSFQSGPFGSSLLHSEFQSTGKLVIGIDNVQAGWFSPGSQHRISDKKYRELARYKARPNDVLITVMATIGRSCVVPADIEEAIITKHIYRMTIDERAALPAFVESCFRGCPRTLSDIHGNVQGQTRPGLNKGILQRVAVPVPPIPEQRVILQALAAEDSSEAYVSKIAAVSATSKQLRQSILSAAFRGDLVH